MALFSKKMILAETCYKTPDIELLAIIEGFQTWRHYLKSCKYEVFMLTDHNNLEHFINTKNMSSKPFGLVKELPKYQFWSEYFQDKANGAADVLSP